MKKERLRLHINGQKFKLNLGYPEEVRIEHNFQNPRLCKITLIRAFIEKCVAPVTITATGQFLDENEVVDFSELLKDNSIVSLSLNDTGINGKGACALFEKLAGNTQLRTLSLDSNHIDNESMKSLNQALGDNSHITTISLANNAQLTSLCVRGLGEAIKSHPSLRQIRIDSLTEFDQLFLSQKIIEDQQVKKGMSGNTPPFSFWKWIRKPTESKPEDVAMVNMQSSN